MVLSFSMQKIENRLFLNAVESMEWDVKPDKQIRKMLASARRKFSFSCHKSVIGISYKF